MKIVVRASDSRRERERWRERRLHEDVLHATAPQGCRKLICRKRCPMTLYDASQNEHPNCHTEKGNATQKARKTMVLDTPQVQRVGGH